MVENLEWYRVFYFIASTGSLSRAAEQLFISQPAVTYTLKQLEARLGGPLFKRTAKGVKLNKEGQVLFTYIEQAYGLIMKGEQKLAELHKLLAWEVTIGAGDFLCRHFLLPYLQTYHERYPDIRIHVTNRTTPETIQLLIAGQIDFGLIHLPVDDERLATMACMQIEDYFVAGQAYSHLADQPVSLLDLSVLPLILLEKGSSSRAFIDAFAARLNVSLKPEIELGSIDLLVEFARSGLGIACVPKNLLPPEQLAALCEIQLMEPIPARSIGLVWLHNTPLTTAAERMIHLISESLG